MIVIWIYVNNRNHIIAASLSDMTGNDGWQQIDSRLMPWGKDLYDNNGAPLYELDNGEIKERPLTDRKADTPMIVY